MSNNNIIWVDINTINPNENNPRTITETQMEKLKKSIQDFPNMLTLRPLVIDETNTVLGGNMRLQALKELEYTQVPIIKAEGLTDEQKDEFVIKDNIGYGDWDWDILQVDWDMELLKDWGLFYGDQEQQQIDYSILDDDDADNILGNMENNVMRGIQIELYPEHYDECQELISFWREREGYIGGMLMEKLRTEKDNL